ncbi:hypothetical protein JL101_035420 (plasmid) [Skermanella rosea]|uniref:hypothetical protein n=1 Tax=Skermanella rosea TaxID=1817965 RepID=UPI0019331F22|nr:hypothetical protein [Skermanella rosea]UEM08089.1 hypothetical protein JL101_035420 [Skermanella rosea]
MHDHVSTSLRTRIEAFEHCLGLIKSDRTTFAHHELECIHTINGEIAGMGYALALIEADALKRTCEAAAAPRQLFEEFMTDSPTGQDYVAVPVLLTEGDGQTLPDVRVRLFSDAQATEAIHDSGWISAANSEEASEPQPRDEIDGQDDEPSSPQNASDLAFVEQPEMQADVQPVIEDAPEPSSKERVFLAWEAGCRTAKEIHDHSSVPKNSVYTYLSVLRKEGRVPPAEVPAQLPPQQKEAVPEPIPDDELIGQAIDSGSAGSEELIGKAITVSEPKAERRGGELIGKAGEPVKASRSTSGSGNPGIDKAIEKLGTRAMISHVKGEPVYWLDEKIVPVTRIIEAAGLVRG